MPIASRGQRPFFDSFDMAMGGVFTVGVLLLTLIHWGPTLTTIVALAIVYFFFGQYIDHPLLSHPGYEPAFVMNYIGLGVTQGFFLFAQTASDDIFFLVIYATTLFRLGHDADDRRSRTIGRWTHERRALQRPQSSVAVRSPP